MSEYDKRGTSAGDEGRSSAEKRAEKFGDRTVGRGMDSPDSTEAVLDSKTGEPDPRATEKRSNDSGSKDK